MNNNIVKIKKPVVADKVQQTIDDYIYDLPKDQVRTPVLYIANYQSIHDLHIIELNKLTMLFGPNSAGKSAIADALEDLSNALIGKPVSSKRFHWSANKDKEVMVLGIGGIFMHQLYSEGLSDVKSDNQKFFKQINESYGGGGYVDILLCLNNATHEGRVCFWKDQYRMARFNFFSDYAEADPPIIYAKDELKKILDNDDYSEDYTELSDDNISSLWEEEYYKNVYGWFDKYDQENDDWDERDQELFEKGFSLYRGIDNKNISWGELTLGHHLFLIPRYATFSGQTIDFFMLSLTHQISTHAGRSSRLGPLRVIPTYDDLKFLNIASIEGDPENFTRKAQFNIIAEYFDATKRRDISNSSGIEYWKKLAESISQNISLYSGNNTELLDEVNKWLVDKFKTGIMIFADTTALQTEQSLPLGQEKPYKTGDHDYSVNVQIGFRSSISKEKISPIDVGVGMSQLVPVIVSSLEENQLFIEQPELHLHPAMQLVVADLIISRLNRMRETKTSNNWLITETHSEHIMLRLLRRIGESSSSDIYHQHYSLKPSEISVYFITPTNQGSVFKKIRIDEDGDFVDNWPAGFFDERASELF